MKKFSIIALLIAVTGLIAVQARTLIEPSKKTETKTFNITNFDELKVVSVYAVQYEQTAANNWSVEITAPQNIMPYVKVRKSGDCLVLGLEKGLSTRGDYDIKVKIKAPGLKEIDMSGASSFKADRINLAGRSFEIEASGASGIDIKSIVATKVEIDINGASTTKIGAVSAQQLEAEASGASTVKVSGIKASSVEGKASGASTVELAGKTDYATLKASGASNVKAASMSAAQGTLEASGASGVNARVANVLSQRASGASSIKNEK